MKVLISFMLSISLAFVFLFFGGAKILIIIIFNLLPEGWRGMPEDPVLIVFLLYVYFYLFFQIITLLLIGLYSIYKKLEKKIHRR